MALSCDLRHLGGCRNAVSDAILLSNLWHCQPLSVHGVPLECMRGWILFGFYMQQWRRAQRRDQDSAIPRVSMRVFAVAFFCDILAFGLAFGAMHKHSKLHSSSSPPPCTFLFWMLHLSPHSVSAASWGVWIEWRGFDRSSLLYKEYPNILVGRIQFLLYRIDKAFL